jgi:hypothetical protein
VVCQQGTDWSRGAVCTPQGFVRLVGYRDVSLKRSPSIIPTKTVTARRPIPNDTPIG